MRIGLLIYASLDFPSGGFLYDRKLVETLQSRGHNVEIVSLPWRKYIQHLGDNFSAEVFQRLRQLDVDLLLQDELCHPSLYALNQRLKSQVHYPIISIVHHLRVSETRPMFLKWLFGLIERRYLESVDAFIVNSHTTKSVVEGQLGKSKPHVVAQPAGNRLKPDVSAVEIEQRVRRSGPLQGLFVGALIPRKAPDVILQAMSLLPLGRVEFYFAGSLHTHPAYAEELRRFVRTKGLDPHVHFLGHLEDEDLAKLLRASHVLVLPSIYEGFGIVYLEAMGFGLPAIGTRRGAAAEIIRDGENGYLIDVGSFSQLAARLAELHADRQRLLKMGREAQRHYSHFPTWEQSMAQAARFLETYI